jgi:hypothetical protein
VKGVGHLADARVQVAVAQILRPVRMQDRQSDLVGQVLGMAQNMRSHVERVRAGRRTRGI